MTTEVKNDMSLRIEHRGAILAVSLAAFALVGILLATPVHAQSTTTNSSSTTQGSGSASQTSHPCPNMQGSSMTATGSGGTSSTTSTG
jgi:hypothetical protein